MRFLSFRPVLLLAMLLCINSQGYTQEKLELQPKDHIALVGNTLPDRMQHEGYLETYLHSRFPKHDLTIRNLGYSGDELTIRFRSAAFGEPAQWQEKVGANVIFAFFGYNESYGDTAGLEKFKKDLTEWVVATREGKPFGVQASTGGRSASKGPYKPIQRIVLFSPIAFENLHSTNLPDGKEHNRRLSLYTQAMADVAKANKVVFVDLFHPTLNAYPAATRPWTINGVHLNDHGNAELAKIIDTSLFGPTPPSPKFEEIRTAVKDLNFHWFMRYRTVDGYSVYGGRADLKFVGGQTNRVVAQREMEILDEMCELRDHKIWAVCKGENYTIDDSKTKDFIPVQTNKPGPLAGGLHQFLDGKEAISKMTVGKGMKVNLFADEKMFPDLIKPVQMTWDTQGRLWVATWNSYPHWKPKDQMNDKILILEDTKGTGVADKCTVFADGLHCPTGFEFWNGGILVAQQPNIVFLKDTKGSGKADYRETVISGIDSADTHHAANSFVLDPGGAIYFQEGTFHHSQIETPYTPSVRNANAGVYRYVPRTQSLEVYVAYPFANPHGHIFDRWGQDIVIDGTGSVPYQAALFSGQVDGNNKHNNTPTVYRQRTRPCPGMEILSSSNFPEEMQGNLLVGNVIGFQGILRYKLNDQGSEIKGIEQEPIVYSSDPNFRPSDLKVGPDGAIYISDWQNPIIGHMQHNLRDPSRDHLHGRVYRVTYEGRPLEKPVKIAGESTEKLLELLKDNNDRVRYRARVELTSKPTAEVVAALNVWVNNLKSDDPNYEHNMLEALWLHQSHNVLNEQLLLRELRAPEEKARAAATRVLCYMRDHVKKPIELLRIQINDSSPRVRLEAIRALSFFRGEEALSAALELLSQPLDEGLNYVFNETLVTLERRLGTGKIDQKNIAAGLVAMLNKGSIPDERKPALIETICKHGTKAELKSIWDKFDSYPPSLQKKVLGWLSEAATSRLVLPSVEDASVVKLLSGSHPELIAEAIRLAAAWKTKSATPEIEKVATDSKASLSLRQNALDALASFKDAETLKKLTAAENPLSIRFKAATALAQFDLTAGANAAASALALAKESDDPAPVVEAFILRKGGTDALAAALEKQKIDADGAKRILRAMYLAGKDDPKLSAVVSKFAGLEASPKLPTDAEIKRLTEEVIAQGDAKRGEAVFRRMDLGCMKCHAVNKAGGNIGPDLCAIGGSSPVDYVVESILNPSAKIKEEYLTKSITTSSGVTITGIVVERNKNLVVLKDATGKLTKIPVSDIEEEKTGKSLMPEGITRILTKGELLDLMRFVSELGKAGPYAIRKETTIQRWKLLKSVPAEIKDSVPNREQVREIFIGGKPEIWENVYSQTSGSLPLTELKKAGQSVVYLQGEIEVKVSGQIAFLIDSKNPISIWIDEEEVGKGTSSFKLESKLEKGRHKISVRTTLPAGNPGDLRIEVKKPAGSVGEFEIVHSGE